jgi:hypothetical protein
MHIVVDPDHESAIGIDIRRMLGIMQRVQPRTPSAV